ncbi:MAG: hypothetical protein MJE12_14520 [Alphaproteobacteria bacterium]|nr:hypothetical protein [Alphaproteobacteria bacterium]
MLDSTAISFVRGLRRFAASVATAACLIAAPAAFAAECWQGWGYLVEPKTLAFKSTQALYVTDGKADWKRKDWIKLYPVDPNTGRRSTDAKPVFVRPTKPIHKGTGGAGEIVEDVAEVKGSKWSMMLRLSHIAPSPHAKTLNDSFSRWACGHE